MFPFDDRTVSRLSFASVCCPIEHYYLDIVNGFDCDATDLGDKNGSLLLSRRHSRGSATATCKRQCIMRLRAVTSHHGLFFS